MLLVIDNDQRRKILKRGSHKKFRALRDIPSEELPYLRSAWKKSGNKAPMLSAKEIAQIEKFIIENSNIPEADLLKFRLTIYAGLRVSEVAGLTISDLIEKDGEISGEVSVRAEIGKCGKARRIPMHPKVAEAVNLFREACPEHHRIALSRTGSRIREQSASALTVYLKLLYRDAGLPFHSSHSGRRTFITNLTRKIGQQFTVRDVQILAGHARLETTERYIEPSGNIRELIGRLK